MIPIESLLSARLFMSPQRVGNRLFFISTLSGKLSLYAMNYGGSVPEPLLPPDIALQNPILLGGKLFYVFPKLKQIVVNLLSNAVKFTPPGGRITVRAAEQADALSISVSDTGVGIAPEEQGPIFEPFYQIDRGSGTGLGLPLSRELARLHDGELGVESALGQGSVFTLRLPH